MTDQTPDPWKGVKQRRAKVWEQSPRGLGPGGFYSRDQTVYLASDVDRARNAERAQHQQEIAKIDTDFEAVLAAVDAERNDWRAELAQRDETIRQLRDWQATVTASLGREGGAFYEDVPKHIREMRAQIATLTQELSVSRANHIDANQRNMQSVRELEAAEARCATLQGAVAADEERLRQAAARAGVLFVGCDTADALADRCATLTAAMERALTFHQTTHIHAVLRAAIDAHQQGVPTP